jgi:hypothetical protein
MAMRDIDEPFEPAPPGLPLPATARPARLRAPKGIQVVRFHVWQDLTVGSEKDAVPLHVTITFEMTNEWYEALSQPNGTIRLQGVKPNETMQGTLLLHQAHYGLGLIQPGSRQLQFVMSPTQRCPRLSDHQMVRGTVRIKFGKRNVRIDLPETKVIFTR